MSFELFLAKRYLKSRRRTTIISTAGVCVGVAALIVVLAVFTGFQSQLKATMVSVHPHLKIEKWGGVKDWAHEVGVVQALNMPGVRSIAPYVSAEAILQSESTATGVMVKGVDGEREDLSIFQNNLVMGSLDLSDTLQPKTVRRFFFFKKTIQVPVGKILIGESLAYILRVRVGDQLTLIAPTFESGFKKLSGVRAETKTFIVGGIYHLGMSDFDTSFVMTSLERAQELYHLENRVSGIGIRFKDVDQALKWSVILRGQLTPDYVVSSWHDVNPTFFRALKVEKSVQMIFLGLIILVAAFNIFSTLIMIVMEKTRDIGILQAIGATRASIRKIFLMQGTVVGILGVLSGAAAGLLLLFYRNNVLDFIKETTGFELFPRDIYLFDGLPAEIRLEDIAIIVVLALSASILAAVYPAYRASQLKPVEALRYE
ncbi:MAG: ABC transporter permease [Candidatus Omnitrophica bacterium]|nr:ABC transporter permease [Candidatus Omnitrophota bacterium]